MARIGPINSAHIVAQRLESVVEQGRVRPGDQGGPHRQDALGQHQGPEAMAHGVQHPGPGADGKAHDQALSLAHPVCDEAGVKLRAA